MVLARGLEPLWEQEGETKMPGQFGGVTGQFANDPLGFIRKEVDYWGNRVSKPFGTEGGFRDAQMGQQEYMPTEADYQTGFDQTNPTINGPVGERESWVERLKRKLLQGGQVLPNVGAQSQMQQSSPQNPMASRSQDINSSYNQGRQLGQAGRAIYGAFGGKG